MEKTVNSQEYIDGIRIVDDYKEIADALKNGETIYHWEGGFSLQPLIRDLEYCIIHPIRSHGVERGDIVFCRVNGHYMIHQVWDISTSGYDEVRWFKIGDTAQTFYGWTTEIYGVAYGTNMFKEL